MSNLASRNCQGLAWDVSFLSAKIFAETDKLTCRYPKPEDLKAFRIPHGSFIKMHAGTWHAGQSMCLHHQMQQAQSFFWSNSSHCSPHHKKSNTNQASKRSQSICSPTQFVLNVQTNICAGPLFQDASEMDFYNLELKDTNVVDHNTHSYAADNLSFLLDEGDQ